jgi:hypothetical protein
MFRNLGSVKQLIMGLVPNVERIMLIRRTLEKGISCYRKMYEEKKKASSVKTRLHLLKQRLKNIFLESSISIFHSFCISLH